MVFFFAAVFVFPIDKIVFPGKTEEKKKKIDQGEKCRHGFK